MDQGSFEYLARFETVFEVAYRSGYVRNLPVRTLRRLISIYEETTGGRSGYNPHSMCRRGGSCLTAFICELGVEYLAQKEARLKAGRGIAEKVGVGAGTEAVVNAALGSGGANAGAGACTVTAEMGSGAVKGAIVSEAETAVMRSVNAEREMGSEAETATMGSGTAKTGAKGANVFCSAGDGSTAVKAVRKSRPVRKEAGTVENTVENFEVEVAVGSLEDGSEAVKGVRRSKTVRKPGNKAVKEVC